MIGNVMSYYVNPVPTISTLQIKFWIAFKYDHALSPWEVNSVVKLGHDLTKVPVVVIVDSQYTITNQYI